MLQESTLLAYLVRSTASRSQWLPVLQSYGDDIFLWPLQELCDDRRANPECPAQTQHCMVCRKSRSNSLARLAFRLQQCVQIARCIRSTEIAARWPSPRITQRTIRRTSGTKTASRSPRRRSTPRWKEWAPQSQRLRGNRYAALQAVVIAQDFVARIHLQI